VLRYAFCHNAYIYIHLPVVLSPARQQRRCFATGCVGQSDLWSRNPKANRFGHHTFILVVCACGAHWGGFARFRTRARGHHTRVCVATDNAAKSYSSSSPDASSSSWTGWSSPNPSPHYRRHDLYRVLHALSSVCFISDTRSVKEWFAECHPRQKQTHDNSTVCLVPDTRRACERSQQCLVGQFYRPPLGHLSTSSVKWSRSRRRHREHGTRSSPRDLYVRVPGTVENLSVNGRVWIL